MPRCRPHPRPRPADSCSNVPDQVTSQLSGFYQKAVTDSCSAPAAQDIAQQMDALLAAGGQGSGAGQCLRGRQQQRMPPPRALQPSNPPFPPAGRPRLQPRLWRRMRCSPAAPTWREPPAAWRAAWRTPSRRRWGAPWTPAWRRRCPGAGSSAGGRRRPHACLHGTARCAFLRAAELAPRPIRCPPQAAPPVVEAQPAPAPEQPPTGPFGAATVLAPITLPPAPEVQAPTPPELL